MIIKFLYISIRIVKVHEIGKMQKKCNFGIRATIPPEKKFNGPLFPNLVKLWPKTSDIVFVCPKVLGY